MQAVAVIVHQRAPFIGKVVLYELVCILLQVYSSEMLFYVTSYVKW